MNNVKVSWLFTIVVLANSFECLSQHSSVFSLVKGDERLADQYVQKKDYQSAIALYESKYERKKQNNEIGLKIANCYYSLKKYNEAFGAYQKLAERNAKFSKLDLLQYAEASISAKNTKKAESIFRDLLDRFPEDSIVANKLWRISNIQYLYEDSIHYVVRPIRRLNSPSSEIVVSATAGELTFLSDRPEVKMIEKVDAAGVNLYRLYQSKRIADTTLSADLRFSRPIRASGTLNMKSQSGPMSFYEKGNKVVYATTSTRPGKNGKRTLQLHFAEKINNAWKTTQEFPFNNIEYSLTDPSISADGQLLYFTSDMPGGKGGKDIYRSAKVNEQWSKPENMAMINSPLDDMTPFKDLERAIYFSSNGHPGIGGFDIFKIERRGNHWTEVVNVGYPINSHADDFGFLLDSLGYTGYFTSNRKNGGLDDDMYNVEIDIQSYPITIPSLVRMKEHSWSDSSALIPYANAKFTLIDNVRNSVVYESFTDASGAVSVTIPYFSKYKISITGQERDEHVVSFDIPKNSKVDDRYDIVLVKDIYESATPADNQNKDK
jgi:tetratricopeptide (TPR) repeat protein